MRDALFHVERDGQSSIQSQIRKMLVSAILAGQLPSGDPLPSSRRMAKTLGVSRNTVILAYQGLVDDGFLSSRERSGFFVDDSILAGMLPDAPTAPNEVSGQESSPASSIDWDGRFRMRPGRQSNLNKPADWQSYPYPFIYGQVDQGLFPIAAWRECSRQALGRKGMDTWTSDAYTLDDPMLIEQIRTRLLPRRGIMVAEDNILVTLGAQNALYMLSSLLMMPDTVVGMEEPGYPDVRNIFGLKTDHIRPIPVDGEGLPVDQALDGCAYLYTTPSHQFPTTVTMPMERRRQLLVEAQRRDLVIIEDDYEFETNYVSEPTPALKSLDKDDRVIYVGSLSKTLFPGLRLGYVVAAPALIDEMRALRRLMLRHPPNNNQRTTALFLALGHHDSLIHKLHKAYHARWECLGDALSRYLPDMAEAPSFGGTSFWVRGPEDLDAEVLAEHALEEGVIIEPGSICFARDPAPRNYFRLGFSSIPLERIEPGVEILGRLIRDGVGRRKS